MAKHMAHMAESPRNTNSEAARSFAQEGAPAASDSAATAKAASEQAASASAPAAAPAARPVANNDMPPAGNPASTRSASSRPRRSTAPTHTEDIEDFGSAAPRPLDTETISRASLQQLGKGQGAKAARARRSAAPISETIADKRVLAIVVVAALLTIGMFVFVIFGLLGGGGKGPEEQAEAEHVEVKADESITYHDSTYTIKQGEKHFELIETPATGGEVSLGEIQGTPVELILNDATFIVPENLKDGKWDVVAYTIGSGWSQITNQEGTVYGGDGEITEASLDGTTLRLVVSGNEVEVPLAW